MSPVIRSRGYLPHLEAEHSVYFVTFRLVDSLPQPLLFQLRKEYQQHALSAGALMPLHRIRLEASRALIRKAERHLDSGAGQCHLRNPRIANTVVEAIRVFDCKRYQILAWCVMPNHVHVVLTLFPTCTLDTILHSWKSFSAHEANRLLHRSGRFWQPEYFDHLFATNDHWQELFAT